MKKYLVIILFIIAIVLALTFQKLMTELLPNPVSPVKSISPSPILPAALPTSKAIDSLDALLEASDRLALCCRSEHIMASGLGITFLCRYRQYDRQTNVIDFQDCIIHIDDATRFYEIFDVYLPVVEK